MEVELTDLLGCARETAMTAGRYALANAQRRRETIRVAENDVKLRLDVECQERAAEVIRGAFPEHAMLAEEDTPDSGGDETSDYEWIVDPIDGTVNFTHGLPFWCCSVAVRRGENVVAGAIYAPAVDELFLATEDSEATCNGEPIRVSDIRGLDEAMVMSGLEKSVIPGLEAYTILNAIAANVQKGRVMGSAALDMCCVARGQAEGYFEAGIFTWDVSAAALIVRRAGGRTELLKHLAAPHRLCFLATNGHIHRALREIVEPLLG